MTELKTDARLLKTAVITRFYSVFYLFTIFIDNICNLIRLLQILMLIFVLRIRKLIGGNPKIIHYD